MKKIAAVMILMISLLQCTNNTPLPNGYELLDRENKIGLVPPVTIQPIRLGAFWEMVPTGSKTSLLLGTGQDCQSFIIFHDRNLAKIETDATVISATLSMYSMVHVGDTTPFSITAHRFTQAWDEATVVWNDVKDAYSTAPIETWEFSPGDTTWYKFEFSNIDFIAEWIDDTQSSSPTITGMVLAFDQADGGTSFRSSESTTFPPYIQVVTQNVEGTLDTTVTYLTHDASLMQNTGGIAENELIDNPETLKIGNGTGWRALIQFDLSEIPKEATIHKAQLSFFIDHDQTWGDEITADGSYSVAIGGIDSGAVWSDPTTIFLNSQYSSGIDVATSANQTFAFDSPAAVQAVSRIVQRWVSGIEPNNGALIYPYYQANDFQEMAFKSGTSDASVLPSLEITYALPAAHRFARP